MVSNEWSNVKHAEVTLTKNLPQATNENQKKSQSGLPISGQRFNPGSPDY
jgi:hypothetical protein